MAIECDAQIKSCLTDKPVQSCEEDNLRASDYANALGQFIKNADTPVTIGIQGGWGSGKTSLITVLQEQLNSDPEHLTLCVLVNAWEHSLFHGSDSKADVALSLLNGLAAGVKKSVSQAKWLDTSASEVIDKQSAKVETAINGLKLGLMFAGKVAAQMAANVMGAGDISNVKVGIEDKNAPAVRPLAENVHNLRSGLEEMIKKITYKKNPVKVVFFIDDLDRVPPPTAVEILDITKNIFDIPDCVFVLAIDYEVVVKGLEEKFGKKNADNEREFRQYFDKIIQIPFTMPVGAYGENLLSLLQPALARLGNKVEATDDTTLKNLAEDARLATGGIPRSIKRIINTLSLLQHIANAKSKNTGTVEKNSLPKDLEARFIIVALHINFPEICRKLMEKPDFPQWTATALNLPWKLNVDDNKKELEVLGKTELFDDDWEKVVYCLCAASEWLKSQALNISRLMNRLFVVLEDCEGDGKALSEKGLFRLQTILEDMKVVSIDSEAANAPEFDDKSVKTDRVTMFFNKLQDALASMLPGNVMQPHMKEYAKRGKPRRYEISLDGDIKTASFEWDKDEEEMYIAFYGERNNNTKNKCEPILKKIAGDYECSLEGRNEFYFYSVTSNFCYDEFINADEKYINSIAKESVDLYDTVKKAQAHLMKL